MKLATWCGSCRFIEPVLRWPPASATPSPTSTSSGYVYDPSVSHVQDLFEAAKSANDLSAISAVLARYLYHPGSLLISEDLFKYSGEHQSSAAAVEKCLFALDCLGIHHLVRATYNRE